MAEKKPDFKKREYPPVPTIPILFEQKSVMGYRNVDNQYQLSQYLVEDDRKLKPNDVVSVNRKNKGPALAVIWKEGAAKDDRNAYYLQKPEARYCYLGVDKDGRQLFAVGVNKKYANGYVPKAGENIVVKSGTEEKGVKYDVFTIKEVKPLKYEYTTQAGEKASFDGYELTRDGIAYSAIDPQSDFTKANQEERIKDMISTNPAGAKQMAEDYKNEEDEEDFPPF